MISLSVLAEEDRLFVSASQHQSGGLFADAHYHSHDVLAKGTLEEVPLESWRLYALPPQYPPRSVEEILDPPKPKAVPLPTAEHRERDVTGRRGDLADLFPAERDCVAPRQGSFARAQAPHSGLRHRRYRARLRLDRARLPGRGGQQ